MDVELIGAFVFGLVIGWVTYRTLRRSKETVALSDIASVIGAVGGGIVTTQFDTPAIFGWYCIGLGVGFFLYLVIATTLLNDTDWLIRD